MRNWQHKLFLGLLCCAFLVFGWQLANNYKAFETQVTGSFTTKDWTKFISESLILQSFSKKQLLVFVFRLAIPLVEYFSQIFFCTTCQGCFVQ